MDINPNPSPHVEGSVNPVTENAYQGWPNAAVPGVDGKTVNDLNTAGSNIVKTASKANTKINPATIA